MVISIADRLTDCISGKDNPLFFSKWVFSVLQFFPLVFFKQLTEHIFSLGK